MTSFPSADLIGRLMSLLSCHL